MAFSIKMKGLEEVRTTIPYTSGEKYDAVVSDVAVVKGKDSVSEYLRITFKVQEHEELQMFGNLRDTVDENGNVRSSLLKKIAKQLSEERVSDRTFNVVELLQRLEASSHTDTPETIGVYVFAHKDGNKCYLSAKAYASAVQWYAEQEAEDDEDDI